MANESFDNITSIVDMPLASLGVVVSGIKQWDHFREIHFVTNILLQTIGNVMLAGIVWYEEFGGMDQYRTVLNQLAAHVSFYFLFGKLQIQAFQPLFRLQKHEIRA